MTRPKIRRLAQNLRKNQTDVEQLLWSRLLSRRLSGFKFRRQHPIDNYILDFYCNEAQLAIEIDGGQHAEEKNIKRDYQRTTFLNQKGIRVIRYWNNDVLENIDEVLEDIHATLKEITSKK